MALLERYGFLGGNFTVASVGTMCGLYVRTAPGEFDHVTGGFARSFTDELAARGAAIGPYPFKDTAVAIYVPWAAKRLADHLITEGPLSDNITLLLHALVSDVVVGPATGDITGVIVASKQGPRAVLGSVVIDATGYSADIDCDTDPGDAAALELNRASAVLTRLEELGAPRSSLGGAAAGGQLIDDCPDGVFVEDLGRSNRVVVLTARG